MRIRELFAEAIDRDGLHMDVLHPSILAAEDLAEAYRVPTVADINRAAANANPEPSASQRDSGNYAKGHLTIHGLPVTIEIAKGRWRRGVSGNGKPWAIQMKWPYGYIKRTAGADGDHVDCFLGPQPESEIVFVVDQNRADGTFDEHKVFVGWTNSAAAKEAYLSNYDQAWKGFAGIRAMTIEEFRAWLDRGDQRRPAVVREALTEEARRAVILASLMEEAEPGPGFTGEVTDSLGRRRKYVDGKPVALNQEEPSAAKPRVTVKQSGEEVEVVAKDSKTGLVRVRGTGGDRVVKAAELDDKPKEPEADQKGLMDRAKQVYTSLHEMGHSAFKLLPEPVQKGVAWTIATAFAGWRASQTAAERIAKEKGATPEEAAKLRSVLAAWDLVAFKPVAVATAPLGWAVAAASWVMPPVTAAYLAYSVVTNPAATFRAARGIVGDAATSVGDYVADHTQEL